MIEINLIPDVKREFLKTRSMRNFVVTLSILVTAGAVALAVILGLVFSGQLVVESVQTKQIKEEGGKLTSIKDLNKTVTIQQQLAVIEDQHSQKTIDSRLFNVMAAINPQSPNDIRISLLRLDPEDKTITIEGSATNGYLALEVFKKTILNTKIQTKEEDELLETDLTTDIVTGDTSFGENAEGQYVLRFTFTFTYADELFMYSKDPVTLITPVGKVDVTDSKLGIPESLFEERARDASVERGGE